MKNNRYNIHTSMFDSAATAWARLFKPIDKPTLIPYFQTLSLTGGNWCCQLWKIYFHPSDQRCPPTFIINFYNYQTVLSQGPACPHPSDCPTLHYHQSNPLPLWHTINKSHIEFPNYVRSPYGPTRSTRWCNKLLVRHLGAYPALNFKLCGISRNLKIIGNTVLITLNYLLAETRKE